MPGYYYTSKRLKEDAAPIDNITKFFWTDDDFEEYQEWYEYSQEELNMIELQKQQEEQQQNVSELIIKVAELTARIEELLQSQQ